MTNVDKKIASRETIKVSVGHGDRSSTNIHIANNATCM
jgi:hypothetical protein